ncbi:glycine betaine/carnitine/choline transport protein [Secundilactobacillus pentosiphilus]|uniref:Glycine betaine/carnitine/choline transport protein n=1 Tax=Secundilactobacillus pentosiphilus TaxID=1714682 RepID=A0A1Z5ISK6_9LACO|nr:glycine betaine/carnitine/choline transport protein [Secundilactobacillus pentosiphilus]GAX04745.1 glycine betaine/carnitine/choline transport protein [Secundilactobacillus pentosiphilus]
MGLFLLATLVLMIGGKGLQSPLSGLLSWMNLKLGWMYLSIYIINFVFLIGLAFSRYGKIKIGKPDDKPVYSGFKWGAMVFATAIDASIMMLSITDPLTVIQNPPFHLKAYSNAAYVSATMTGQFNWGPMAWMMFAPAAVLIGYLLYRKGQPVQKLSDGIGMLDGDKHQSIKRFVGGLINVLVVIGIIGGVGSSIGMEVPITAKAFSSATGIKYGLPLEMGLFFVLFCLFAVTVFKGLNGGIDRLSMAHIWLAIGFLVLILLFGPTRYIITNEARSLGMLVQKFVPMATNTHPSAPQQDTIFYWGWWLSYMPVMGLFIAKISRGKTIRQMLMGMLMYGFTGCALFYAVMGGYSLWLQQNGVINLVHILNTQGQAAVIATVIGTLPMKQVMTLLYCLSCFIFLATTISGSAYILSSFTSTPLKRREPTRFNRMTWVVVFMVFAISLVLVGGFKVIQTISVLAGFPLIGVCAVILMSIRRLVKHDHELVFTPSPEITEMAHQPVTVERKSAIRGKLILSPNRLAN